MSEVPVQAQNSTNLQNPHLGLRRGTSVLSGQALVNAIIRECEGTHRVVVHRQRLGHPLDTWHGFDLLWADCLLVLDRRDDLHQERHREGLLNTNVFCAHLG